MHKIPKTRCSHKPTPRVSLPCFGDSEVPFTEVSWVYPTEKLIAGIDYSERHFSLYL